jgi:hypothetical protein
MLIMSSTSVIFPVLLLCGIGSIATTHSRGLMLEAFLLTSPVRSRNDVSTSSTFLFSDYQKQLEALTPGDSSHFDSNGQQQSMPSSSSPPKSMGSYLDSLSQPQEYHSSVQFEEAPLQEVATSTSTMAPAPPAAPVESTPLPPPAPTKPTVAASAASLISSKAAPMKIESSPTLSVTSPTIGITLPVGLRPPKLEKPKNIKYGEESRIFRRTVYTHDDWERHRSPDRFVRNLASVMSSGVYKVRRTGGI